MKAMDEQSNRLKLLIEENRMKKEKNMEKARSDAMLDRLAALEERHLDGEDEKFFKHRYKKKTDFNDLLRVQQKYQRHMISSMM